jgi:hypothetical protein
LGELLAGVIIGPSLLGWVAPKFEGWLTLLRRRRATAARISLAGLLIPLGLGVDLPSWRWRSWVSTTGLIRRIA